MPRSLQAEIKQSVPFRSAETEALLSILRTAAVIDHYVGDVLRPFGITPTQNNVLRILRGAGSKGLCGREIGERMIARVPDVPRMLERMETLKLINRERDPDDRRNVTARITEKGLALLARLDVTLDKVEQHKLRHLDRDQLQKLIETLAAVRDGF